MSKTKDAAIQADNNLALWHSVETTDPDHTKPVSFGRNFTAIDAHYQVKMATKAFGPIGKGWGYNTQFETFTTSDGQDLIFCDLTFWWKKFGDWEGNKITAGHCSFGPIRGCAKLYDTKRIDADAPKKAMTDALTKCLSHLGFNADVFLGMFDDNKYVTHLREKKKGERSKRTAFIKEIEGALSNDGINVVMDNYKEWIDNLETKDELLKWVTKERLRFTDKGEQDGSE
jgi:uncharacterized short protein YbdD (DUF466 family)